jgi:hypothetical protein
MTPGRRSHPTTISAITIRSIPAESFIDVLERLFEHILVLSSAEMPILAASGRLEQEAGWVAEPAKTLPGPEY